MFEQTVNLPLNTAEFLSQYSPQNGTAPGRGTQPTEMCPDITHPDTRASSASIWLFYLSITVAAGEAVRAPSPPPKSSVLWESWCSWSSRTCDRCAPTLQEEKGRQAVNFHVLNSVLRGEDRGIIQEQRPSTALLLEFGFSPLLLQASEMNYPVSGQVEGFVWHQTFFCLFFWGGGFGFFSFQMRKKRDGGDL